VEPRAPVTPRKAATVVLVRAAFRGCEVYLQKRADTLRFAPGHHVFPGGALDPADGSREILARLSGGGAWGCDPELTAAHVVGAVRECYEESGVLFARDADGRPVREAPTPGEFLDVVRRDRLVLDGAALRHFSHWTTPASSPVRFDTRFFLARLPDRAMPRPCGRESVEGGWWAPDAALAALADRRMRLLAPTEVTLGFLAQFESLDALWRWCDDGTVKIAGLPLHDVPAGLTR
jgi:8-oxo-dGTP pyrophosphatase MutT (NUDIX family)